MDPLTIGAGLWALGTTAYNVYQNWQTKKREDNAAQRRVADLRAAGLSPTLAAGSPAATSDYGLHGEQNPIGSALDAKFAKNQIQQQEYETSILKDQADIVRFQRNQASRENSLNNLSYMMMLGYKPSMYDYSPNKDFDSISYYDNVNTDIRNGNEYWRNLDFANSPFVKSFNRQQEAEALGLENLGYDTEMNRKANAWYNFNQGFDAVNQGLGTVFNGVSTFGSLGMNRARLNLMKTEQGLRYSPFNESVEYYDSHGRYRGTRRKYSNR